MWRSEEFVTGSDADSPRLMIDLRLRWGCLAPPGPYFDVPLPPAHVGGSRCHGAAFEEWLLRPPGLANAGGRCYRGHLRRDENPLRGGPRHVRCSDSGLRQAEGNGLLKSCCKNIHFISANSIL